MPARKTTATSTVASKPRAKRVKGNPARDAILTVGILFIAAQTLIEMAPGSGRVEIKQRVDRICTKNPELCRVS